MQKGLSHQRATSFRPLQHVLVAWLALVSCVGAWDSACQPVPCLGWPNVSGFAFLSRGRGCRRGPPCSGCQGARPGVVWSWRWRRSLQSRPSSQSHHGMASRRGPSHVASLAMPFRDGERQCSAGQVAGDLAAG